MGKDRSKYIKKKGLHEQAYERLTSMLSLGNSKKEDRITEDGIQDKIYSKSTYDTYKKHIKYFLQWIKQNHPEVKSLKQAKKYVNEWLEFRVNSFNAAGEQLSAWTIHTEEAALNKLYGIRPDDPERFKAPQRKRGDIKRSRGTKVRDTHFSEKANEELVNFCKGCGVRRNVLERLRGRDLMSREQVEDLLNVSVQNNQKDIIAACKDALEYFGDQDYFLIHRKDKGGKTRISPIVGPNKHKIVQRMKDTKPDDLVWWCVHSNCDVHGYRSDYATYIYKHYARPVEQLDYRNKILCADGKYRSEIYVCRTDERGKKLDRMAVKIVSKALGHNREDTAITSYIRNI